MLTLSGADRAQLVADITNASVFLSAVREANRRKLGADRAVDASVKSLEAFKGQLAALGDEASVKERTKLLALARLKLDSYQFFAAKLESLDKALANIARLDDFLEQATRISAPPAHLRTLLHSATEKRMMVESLTAELISLDVKERKIARKSEELKIFEAEYHELLLQRSNTTVTCPKCGEEVNVS